MKEVETGTVSSIRRTKRLIWLCLFEATLGRIYSIENRERADFLVVGDFTAVYVRPFPLAVTDHFEPLCE